jgi:hypothetical protein
LIRRTISFSFGRECKGHGSQTIAGILERLGSTVEIWSGRLKKLLESSQLVGTYITTQPPFKSPSKSSPNPSKPKQINYNRQ